MLFIPPPFALTKQFRQPAFLLFISHWMSTWPIRAEQIPWVIFMSQRKGHQRKGTDVFFRASSRPTPSSLLNTQPGNTLHLIYKAAVARQIDRAAKPHGSRIAPPARPAIVAPALLGRRDEIGALQANRADLEAALVRVGGRLFGRRLSWSSSRRRRCSWSRRSWRSRMRSRSPGAGACANAEIAKNALPSTINRCRIATIPGSLSTGQQWLAKCRLGTIE